VNRESLEQQYALKTDGELLGLAAERPSLTEEAKQILTKELSRRNLEEATLSSSQPTPDHSFYLKPVARWTALWLLHSFIATFGSLINVGIITYFFREFLNRTTMWNLTQTFIYRYPFPILVALALGFFSYMRSRGSYRYWVWVLPAIGLIFAIASWKQSRDTTWSTSLKHFIEPVPFPDYRDQLASTVLLYMSLAYALGAWCHQVVDSRLRFSPMPAKLLRKSAI
jgi:hypothetical protein